MICKYCGSTSIVWDEVLGIVVCTTCGSVLQSILEYSHVSFKQKEAKRKARRLVKREDYIVATSRLITNNYKASIESISSKKALKALESSKNLRSIFSIINTNPILKARTLRVKVAIATYIYYRILGYSKRKSKLYTAKITGISIRTIDKIESKYRKLISALETKTKQNNKQICKL
ncbi:MAG: TFIIB-type zinc ribbon-containing protein [Acidilobaceae archaeon]